MPVAVLFPFLSHPCFGNQKCLQELPDLSWGIQSSWLKNHCSKAADHKRPVFSSLPSEVPDDYNTEWNSLKLVNYV